MHRLREVPDLARLMPVSLNGVDPALIAESIVSGEYAVVVHGECMAVVSCDGHAACIEMIEGRGGVDLTRRIVLRALHAGLRCEGWVLSKSRAKMAAQCGMHETGKTRDSVSGRIQYQVST